MKNRLFIAAVVTVCAAIPALAAPYNGPWFKTWEFSDGQNLEGWQLVPGTGAAFWDNSYGAGSLAFADAGKATIDLSSMNFGSGAGKQAFVMQADVLYLASNVMQGHTIGMDRGDGKGPAVGGGGASSYGAQAKDRSWDNTNRTLGYTFGKGGPNQTGVWMKLQIDYGLTTPGKWSAYVYNPLDNDRTVAGWMTVAADKDVNPGMSLPTLTIGGNGLNGQAAWAQTRFDNVRITPEPATVGLLAVGALIAMRRRRTA